MVTTKEATARVTYTYRVYVIELDDKAGRRVDVDRECVYVGQTTRTAEERFEQHRSGHMSSRVVRKYGLKLRPDLSPGRLYRTRREAERAEAEWARKLKARGHRVFGGH